MAWNTMTQQRKMKRKLNSVTATVTLKIFGFKWENIAVANLLLQIIY